MATTYSVYYGAGRLFEGGLLSAQAAINAADRCRRTMGVPGTIVPERPNSCQECGRAVCRCDEPTEDDSDRPDVGRDYFD